MELTRAVAREVGLDARIRLGPWAETVEALRHGELDAIQGMFYTHERSRTLDFSPRYMVVHCVSVVRRGAGRPPATFAELAGRDLVIQTGDAILDELHARGVEASVVTVATQEDVVRAVAEGRHDCGLTTRAAALYFMQRHGWSDLVLGTRAFYSADYCYAVPKGNAALLANFTEGLAAVKASGEYQRIYDRWLSVYAPDAPAWRTVLRHVAWFAGPLLLVAMLALAWSWSLRGQVKRKTLQIREREAFFRKVLNNLPVGVAVNSVQPGVQFEYMNDLFPEFYRTTREALEKPGSFWDAVYEDPQFRSEIRGRVEADCAAGDPARMFWTDVPITRAGRETTYITARNTPVSGTSLMISSVWDVTERRHTEEQLLQARKMESVGRLAGGVAHDFNNILTGILNYAELCRDRIEANHPIREWLEEITREAERSADLTRQLLAFARRQTIDPRVLDLNRAVENMLKMLRRLIRTNIELIWRPAADLWKVSMDPVQIDQILVNLCVNARDSIAGSGTITIETQNAAFDADGSSAREGFRPGRYAMLSVSDNGQGMDRETREHIFEPFFTTKGPGEGTGLGLATVYGIVRQNEGFINVCSAPGRGAAFHIYLPRAGDDGG